MSSVGCCWSGAEAVEVLKFDGWRLGEVVAWVLLAEASRMGSARWRIERGAVRWEAWSCARSAAGSGVLLMFALRLGEVCRCY